MKKTDDIKFTPSSGNVFADLGLPNPEESLLKARLSSLIYDTMEARAWTQEHTAEVLKIRPADVSDISRGRGNFSVEQLLTFLGKLNHCVTITVSSDDLPTQEIEVTAKVA